MLRKEFERQWHCRFKGKEDRASDSFTKDNEMDAVETREAEEMKHLIV